MGHCFQENAWPKLRNKLSHFQVFWEPQGLQGTKSCLVNTSTRKYRKTGLHTRRSYLTSLILGDGTSKEPKHLHVLCQSSGQQKSALKAGGRILYNRAGNPGRTLQLTLMNPGSGHSNHTHPSCPLPLYPGTWHCRDTDTQAHLGLQQNSTSLTSMSLLPRCERLQLPLRFFISFLFFPSSKSSCSRKPRRARPEDYFLKRLHVFCDQQS